MEINKIHLGDCLEGLKKLESNSLDCCVTDPPYGISFMSKKWDYEVPKVEVWREIFRVLKPGGHVLCACGTRTQHRMAVNIEDGGFEIRDVISWHYGNGFPKSLNLGEGRGTALKPATEFWTLARKPLEENTVSDNVNKYGTGGLNIDATRIKGQVDTWFKGKRNADDDGRQDGYLKGKKVIERESNDLGRFPANVIFDEFTAAILDEQSGELTSGASKSTYIQKESKSNSMSGKNYERTMADREESTGGASRFFYVAKPSPSEKSNGLHGFKREVEHSIYDECDTCGGRVFQNKNRPSSCKCAEPKRRGKMVKGNFHPTVKPLELMQYLIRLVCPPGGTVLEPFAGSGSTCIAARKEDKNFIAFELDPQYIEIAERRLRAEIGLFL